MHLQPIIPFEPIATESIPEGKQWISQVKWDGVRVLTYYDGKSVRLFNRKKNERTLHYPELSEIKSFCTADSVILDGEIIALGSDGKPSFHEVMRRDAIRRMDRVEQARNRVPITYMIFDVVFVDGIWTDQFPLEKRMKILSDIIRPNDRVQLVPSYDDSQSLFNAIKGHNMEGIIVKDLNSKYYINGKKDRWQKKKHYKDLFAVIGGVTLRGGVVNSILLGLYDEKGELWCIGHAGTGKLTQSDWRSLTETIQKGMIIQERPFINVPERHKDATWIKPQLTVKIKFMEWTSSKTLRQPSIQSLINMTAKECTFDQT
jgi:bifunctional non-homologous end joining protein LigD